MALIFDDVFTGCRVRPGEKQQQAAVDDRAVGGVAEACAGWHGARPGAFPAMATAAASAAGPLVRMMAIADGGRPLDSAAIVSPGAPARHAISGATACQPSQIILPATHTMTARPT